ncbi:MAG: heparinase II/III family protein [Rhodospirillales bacterium]
MFAALKRKADQVLNDPELRLWLWRRARRLEPMPPAYQPGCPPYLNDPKGYQGETPMPVTRFPEGASDGPKAPLTLRLPGRDIVLDPARPGALFDEPFDDLETMLAAHRFAWVPLQPDADPAWIRALWAAWRARDWNRNDWPWHAYTVAERAINLITWAQTHGLPGGESDTLTCLADHARAIAQGLEYEGEQGTHNHLANNGRGLFLIGLALRLPKALAMGRTILLNEADRLFDASGFLREGSSHYHLLYLRNYRQCAEAAARADDEAAPALAAIAAKAQAAAGILVSSGGLALIGDISPDCPPESLISLLIDSDPETKSRPAGWHCFRQGPWYLLAHAAPEGLPFMPGHGHQDMGGFELHFDSFPVILDLGRGRYGDEGMAAFGREGPAHSTLRVDDQDSAARNKPYYSAAFRRLIAGAPPSWNRNDTGLTLHHHGFERLSGMGSHQRQWLFDDKGLTIKDHLSGRGSHRIERLLHTTLPVKRNRGDRSITLSAGDRDIQVTAESAIQLSPAKRWTAYGRSEAATTLSIALDHPLPWTGRIRLEVL